MSLEFLKCSIMQSHAPQPVTLDFDNEGSAPSRGKLWELIVQEINRYKIIKDDKPTKKRSRSVVAYNKH